MLEDLEPYLQGRLDGMCGIYSTINAFRTACAKAGYRSQIAWRDVFQGILARLELRWKLHDLVPHGLTSYQHSLCVHYVRTYLRRFHKIQTTIEWPLRDRKRVSMLTELKRLGKHLDTEHATAILGYGGQKVEHWTTIVAVMESRLLLADSSGGQTMRINGFTFNRDECLTERMRYVVGPEDLVIITVLRE